MEVCGGNSQAGIRQCLEIKARENAQLLRQAENRLFAAIAKWDEDQKFIKAATAKFTAANKAYATYRTTQCAFAASLGGAAIGNALPMRQLACPIDLDSARTQLLNISAGTLPR